MTSGLVPGDLSGRPISADGTSNLDFQYVIYLMQNHPARFFFEGGMNFPLGSGTFPITVDEMWNMPLPRGYGVPQIHRVRTFRAYGAQEQGASSMVQERLKPGTSMR